MFVRLLSRVGALPRRPVRQRFDEMCGWNLARVLRRGRRLDRSPQTVKTSNAIARAMLYNARKSGFPDGLVARTAPLRERLVIGRSNRHEADCVEVRWAS